MLVYETTNIRWSSLNPELRVDKHMIRLLLQATNFLKQCLTKAVPDEMVETLTFKNE